MEATATSTCFHVLYPQKTHSPSTPPWWLRTFMLAMLKTVCLFITEKLTFQKRLILAETTYFSLFSPAFHPNPRIFKGNRARQGPYSWNFGFEDPPQWLAHFVHSLRCAQSHNPGQTAGRNKSSCILVSFYRLKPPRQEWSSSFVARGSWPGVLQGCAHGGNVFRWLQNIPTYFDNRT